MMTNFKNISKSILDHIPFLKSIYYSNKLSYSQNCEDLTILRYLNFKNGFYVDVGAYDPISISNTYLFYKNNWKGINIEPNVNQYNLFKKFRKRDVNLNIGISLNEKELDYFVFDKPAYNTFSKEECDEIINDKLANLIEKRLIKTKPLSIVFKDQNIQLIDFITIDCEALSFDALKSIDFNLVKIKLICIEESIYGYSKFEDSEIYKFMYSKGFKLVSITGCSCIYLNKNI